VPLKVSELLRRRYGRQPDAEIKQVNAPTLDWRAG
jgi:hypothetical protein